MSAFSSPYREKPLQPYWGAPNSNFNFCEEDYFVSAYIAEVVNTFTNIIYVYYAFVGIKSNKYQRDALLRSFPYLGIASVGILSAWYHTTLKNYSQWADDLSMLVATSAVLHQVFTFDKSFAYTVTFGLALTTVMTLFSIWHCIVDETTCHSILFGIMILVILFKTRAIIHANVPDMAVRAQVQAMSAWSTGSFILGFFLWNIDVHCCGALTSLKRSIGMPWSFILEFHGWWHIFTGIGAYTSMALTEHLTSENAAKPLAKQYAWPVNLFVPDFAALKGKQGVKSNGVNGKMQ
ncbi:hypothetical protein BP5796_02266 [Coleophoma crateriformis]|uniref:Alkaline phytoceramidase n=1 Tax=Coleophoma crateriformis TaxID=565419 RepID=A0A3D8SY52_9HELO|nr:hypothetical protein BP5796_02266 [Coleophoma crateriformis]